MESLKIRLPVHNPWVAVDFDGTLCEDGYYPDVGPPRKGAKEFIQFFHNHGIKVMIFTARTSITGLDGDYQDVTKEIDKIKNWMKKYDIPIDYIFPLPKPVFVLAFFDDKAIHVGPDYPRRCGDGVYTFQDSDLGLDRAIEAFRFRFPTLLSGQNKEDWKKEVLPPKIKVEE